MITIWIHGTARQPDHTTPPTGGIGILVEKNLEMSVIAWILQDAHEERALLDAAIIAFMQIEGEDQGVTLYTSNEELARCVTTGDQFGPHPEQWELLDQHMADHRIEFKVAPRCAKMHYVECIANWSAGGLHGKKEGSLYHGDGTGFGIKLMSDEKYKSIHGKQPEVRQPRPVEPAPDSHPDPIHTSEPVQAPIQEPVQETSTEVVPPGSIVVSGPNLSQEAKKVVLRSGRALECCDRGYKFFLVREQEEKLRYQQFPECQNFPVYTLAESFLLIKLKKEDQIRVHVVMSALHGDLVQVTEGGTIEYWLAQVEDQLGEPV